MKTVLVYTVHSPLFAQDAAIILYDIFLRANWSIPR